MGRSFAVLGMGRFGMAVAQALYEAGNDVLVADKDSELLDQLSSKITFAVCADLSDEKAVSELGLENMDGVIVAMGMDLEASILCVMIAKESGVPYIVAKARNPRMGEILKKVGAHKIVYPEDESGKRTAKLLSSETFLDFFDLSGKFAIVEMKPKEEWIGKNIRNLDLRRKYKINVVAIKHGDGAEFDHIIDPDVPLDESDVLLVMIEKNRTDRL